MKRFSLWLISLALCAAPMGRAEDAATEQRINELNGKIDELREMVEGQRKQIADLQRQLSEVREKQNKPTPNYAVQDDLKRVADFAEKVQKDRIEEGQKIHAELQKLLKMVSTPPPAPAPPKSPRTTTSSTQENSDKPLRADKSDTSDKADKQEYYEYEVQKGDTLDGIVQAYREQLKIKLTRAQVLKANPGLTAEKIYAGRKIRIPKPTTP